MSYHLKMTADDQIERDANGNAITLNRSGQAVPRLPFVELGEARFLTGFTGSYDSVKALRISASAYTAYLKAFKDKVAAYLAAGYIRRRRPRLCATGLGCARR